MRGKMRGNMTQRSAGIDFFRLLAAFLVVAIHVSPLVSISVTGDFILTRIVARVAVPFFFMTSGCFLIREEETGRSGGDAGAVRRLLHFEKKTALLYGAAIVLYLPVNWYRGDFQQEHFGINALKDLVFDGTLYHLWYFPASMLGAWIAWWAVKRLGHQKAFAVTVFLYFVGLLGDSYYGLAEKSRVLKDLYGGLFSISSYTRNGLFFAPVFFVLGSYVGKKWRREHGDCGKAASGRDLCGFCVSMALLLAEGLWLHNRQWQRHDSMYICLLPVMYFLFRGILKLPDIFARPDMGRKCPVDGCMRTAPWAGTVYLVIYLVHPLMILVVRVIAGVAGLQKLLLDNSLVNYAVVCLLSAAAGAGVALLVSVRGRKKGLGT